MKRETQVVVPLLRSSLLEPMLGKHSLLTLDGVSADVCMESPFPVPEAAVEPA